MKLLDTHNYLNKVLLFSIHLLVFSLPLARVATTVPMILLAAVWLIWMFTSYEKKTYGKMETLLFAAMLSFALLNFASFFYSSDKTEGLLQLKNKLPLFFIPLIFYTIPTLSDKAKTTAFNLFLFACSLNIVVGIGRSVLHYFEEGKFLMYSDIISHVQFHTAYFSMFLNFGIAIMLMRIIDLWENHRRKALAYLALIAFFILFQMMTLARMQIAAGILLINLLLISTTILQRKKFQLITLLLLNLLIVGFAISNDKVWKRFSYLRDYEFSFDQERKWNGTSIRLAQWTCAFEAIKEKPIWGYGIGDGHRALTDEYKRKGFDFALKKNYNCHNQYIQSWLMTGLISVLILLFVLFTMFYLSWKSKSTLLFVFSALITLSWIPESMLQTQSGIVFFAVFGSWLFFHKQN